MFQHTGRSIKYSPMKKHYLYAVLLGIGSLLNLYHPAKAAPKGGLTDDLRNIGNDFQRAMQKVRK